MNQNPYLLTLPQLISAKAKISKVAAYYDPAKYSIKGFDSMGLDPTEFREQMRRNFCITLTDAELGAIVMLFDQDGDGTVDSVEFLNEFLKLGNLEKQKIRFLQEKAEKRVEQLRLQTIKRGEKRTERLTAVRIADTFSSKDERSAFRKIGKIAFSYDSMKGGLQGFLESDYISGAEFKEQIRRNFDVKLTAEEAAALLHMFGSTKDEKNNEYVLDCKKFLYHFFRIRRNEIDRHLSHQRMKTEELLKEEELRKERSVEKFATLAEAKIEPATEEDRKNALEKIRRAARYYKSDPFIDKIKLSFEASELTPTAFKEVLKNTFDVKLSPGELDAMVDLFDDNKDGHISCVEFMTTFFKIGQDERTKLHQYHRKREEDLRRAAEELREKRRKEGEIRVKTRVIWPELPPMDDNFGNPSLSGSVHSAQSSMVDFLQLESASIDGKSPMSLGSVGSGNGGGGGGGGDGRPQSEGGTGPAGGGFAAATTPTSPTKRSRKKSVVDILSPDKFAKELAKSEKSLADLYPKASADAKKFIMELEKEERRINAMELRKHRNMMKKLEPLDHHQHAHSHSHSQRVHHGSGGGGAAGGGAGGGGGGGGGGAAAASAVGASNTRPFQSTMGMSQTMSTVGSAVSGGGGGSEAGGLGGTAVRFQQLNINTTKATSNNQQQQDDVVYEEEDGDIRTAEEGTVDSSAAEIHEDGDEDAEEAEVVVMNTTAAAAAAASKKSSKLH